MRHLSRSALSETRRLAMPVRGQSFRAGAKSQRDRGAGELRARKDADSRAVPLRDQRARERNLAVFEGKR